MWKTNNSVLIMQDTQRARENGEQHTKSLAETYIKGNVKARIETNRKEGLRAPDGPSTTLKINAMKRSLLPWPARKVYNAVIHDRRDQKETPG